MAFIIAIIAATILFIIAPLIATWKYYRLSEHSFIMNIVWIIVGIITWPLLPFILASRHKDLKILIMFWGSFLVWMFATAYWLATNQVLIQHIQNAQEQLLI